MNESSDNTARQASSRDEGPGEPLTTSDGENRRWLLLRTSLLFQLKLLADGFRDFLLVPVSIGATLVGLLRSGDDPEREFEQVLDFGRQTERWINLFGTHEPFDTAGDAGNLDQLVTRAERLVREQARQGDVSENAVVALEKALAALQRRGQASSATDRDDAGPAPTSGKTEHPGGQ